MTAPRRGGRQRLLPAWEDAVSNDPPAAWERAMRVRDVILQAVAVKRAGRGARGARARGAFDRAGTDAGGVAGRAPSPQLGNGYGVSEGSRPALSPDIHPDAPAPSRFRL